MESYPEPYVVWRWEGKDKGTRGMITLGNSAKKYTQIVSRTDEALLFIDFQHPEFANNVLFPDRILPEGDSDRLGYTITETPHSMYRCKATVSGIWGMFIRVVLYSDCNTRFEIS